MKNLDNTMYVFGATRGNIEEIKKILSRFGTLSTNDDLLVRLESDSVNAENIESVLEAFGIPYEKIIVASNLKDEYSNIFVGKVTHCVPDDDDEDNALVLLQQNQEGDLDVVDELVVAQDLVNILSTNTDENLRTSLLSYLKRHTGTVKVI